MKGKMGRKFLSFDEASWWENIVANGPENDLHNKGLIW